MLFPCVPAFSGNVFLEECYKNTGLLVPLHFQRLSDFLGRFIIAIFFILALIKCSSNSCFNMTLFVLQSVAIRSYLEVSIDLLNSNLEAYRFLRHIQIILGNFLEINKRNSFEMLQISATSSEVLLVYGLFRIYKDGLSWSKLVIFTAGLWAAVVIHVMNIIVFAYLGYIGWTGRKTRRCWLKNEAVMGSGKRRRQFQSIRPLEIQLWSDMIISPTTIINMQWFAWSNIINLLLL